MSGKGSTPRPYSISQEKFSDNWNAIFNTNKSTLQDRMQSEADLFSIGSLDTSKDWYLIAINPWHKWYFNPKTNETRHILYK